MTRLFTQHPNSVGETYFQHMRVAFRFTSALLLAAIACLLHGVFPFLCTKTGSQIIQKLHHDMVTHRSRITAPLDVNAETAEQRDLSQSGCTP